jgi:hypothetical protein
MLHVEQRTTIEPAFVSTSKPRMLVAIASFGTKNLRMLEEVIAAYRRFSTIDVDVVVVSETGKTLEGAEVVVGLPSKNPWSLPFAHKAVFAQRVDDYDLFAYSEDDIGVTEDNCRAFVDLTAHLAPDEVAGFMRFEFDPIRGKTFPEIHGRFHWRPESVARRGPHIVAQFSNEHAGFYVLNQSQLRQAIASGGFLRPPYEGRYDMLCSAATDPYTSCGLRKVVCISDLDRFLIHHKSNRYVCSMGIDMPNLQTQLSALIEILERKRPATTLCEAATLLRGGRWSKPYYDDPDSGDALLVPQQARSVLSVGAVDGSVEEQLLRRGVNVAAIPLDSVIGAVASKKGIHVVPSTLDKMSVQLGKRQFDCVLVRDLLHLLADPFALLASSAAHVARGGTLLVFGPQMGSPRTFLKRLLRRDGFEKLSSYEEGGLRPISSRDVAGFAARRFNATASVQWQREAGRPYRAHWAGAATAQRWAVAARFAD